MSKPTPKQNFLQTALIMITIFLGVQLFFGQKDQKPVRTLSQLHSDLLIENKKLLDHSILQTSVDYSKELDTLVSKKAITPADAEDRKIEAQILVADTQLKAGLFRNDTGRIRNAFQGLQPFQKRLLDKPAWNQAFPVSATQLSGPDVIDGIPVAGSVYQFPWTSWTGQTLYAETVKTLSARNRNEYVYGIIPGYALMDFLVHLTGANPSFSYAFAALLLALVVRAIVFPLSQKQLMFSRQMSQLVPLTNEIKQKHKDQATQQQKVMELYKEYGINPLAGCFPALIQMPLFLTVYQCMLKYQFKFQDGIFLWINPTTSKATNGFVGANLGSQDYILIAVYGITMVTATLLTPVSDPSQAKQQRWMGAGISIIFTFFMFTGAFPVVSGFVLYWTFTNILATAQSLRAYRMPLPPLLKLNAQGGGVLPRPTTKWQQMMDKMMEEQKKNAERNGKQDDSEKPDDKTNRNGSAKPLTLGSQEPTKTGTPAKHKPKKRK